MLFRHEARRATLYAIAALGALALLLPALSWLVGPARSSALAVLGFGGLATVLVLVGAAVLGVVVPRRRWSDDRAVARWVGTRNRDLASDLLSSVELTREATSRPGAPSPALVDALVVATRQRVHDVKPARLVPAAQMRRAQRLGLIALVVNAVVVIAMPAALGRAWRQLLVSPRGPFDGAQLSEVPLVGDLDARLVYPAYSRRPELRLESSSGDVRGLSGTKVEITARVLVPAERVELVIDDPDKAGAQTTYPVRLDGDRIQTTLVIDKSSRYRFAVRAPSGRRQIETTARTIEAEPDQAPSVELMAPADTLDVTNLRRVELAYTIEDDFGLGPAELVWDAGKDKGRKPIALPTAPGGRAQGKFVWDIGEVVVPSGGEVRYWIEARDNDAVDGPNVGRSRELKLRVVSPRERHEETLDRHADVAEKVVRNLGTRLTLPAEDAAARDDAAAKIREAIVELGGVTAAFDKDPHASDALRKSLMQMRDRLDKLAATEQRVIRTLKPGATKHPTGRFAAIDPKMVAELEDDTILLADWLDRERVEGMLDITDEISAHQKRLAELMAQYEKTRDPRLLDEIERELKALERAYAELESKRRGMPEDVLDQYVNKAAMQAPQGTECLDEVRALMRAGEVAKAQQKLETCRSAHERAAAALESSLTDLRGDKFADEQRKLDEIMNELADVSRDQDDIAAEANRIFESYAEAADELAKEHRREASKKVGSLVERLRKRLEEVDQDGLTPFAREELDIVERRIEDVEHMVADGDIAEALGMAKQAKTHLDTVEGELEAALEDDPKSKWADATQDALQSLDRTGPVMRDLIDELEALAPRPDQIMSADDQRALERLRRREALNKARTQKLSERTKQLAPELPGDTGAELAKKLDGAAGHMGQADERMKAKDPSGAREAARSASDALSKARDKARRAARQAQEGSTLGDEPIKIPGADEYRAPERFREDLLEAMKKQDKDALRDYQDMLKRYYEELAK